MKQSCWLLGPSDFVFAPFQILKLDEHKAEQLVYTHLFIGAESLELDKSINHQLTQSELWQKLATQTNNTICISNGKTEKGTVILDWDLYLFFVLQTVLPCEIKVLWQWDTFFFLLFRLPRFQCLCWDSKQLSPKPRCEGLNPTSSRKRRHGSLRRDHWQWDAATSIASPTGAPPGV